MGLIVYGLSFQATTFFQSGISLHSNTTPPTTTPVDPRVIEQPEVINTTAIVTYNAAGGQPLPIINLPADLYEHFSRRLDYEDILKTGISPRSIFTGLRDKSDNSNDNLRGMRLKGRERGFWAQGKREGCARREGGRETPARKPLFSPSRLLIMYAKITQL